VNGTLTAPSTVMSYNKDGATPKKAYKSVPENWKALSEINYRQVISNLESVLFDISTDGVNLNSPDGNIGAATLSRWAEELRDALEALSKGR
jgi:hypothetical protein